MPQILPLEPSQPFYEIATVLNKTPVTIDVRWNGRDEAWYLSVYDAEGLAIADGLKVVLGVLIGARARHPLFTAGAFVARDTSGKQREAAFDDIGTRVTVTYYTLFEAVAEARARAKEIARG